MHPQRRHLLKAVAACGAAAAGGLPTIAAMAQASSDAEPAATWLGRMLTVDMHSHAGRIIISRQSLGGASRPFLPLARPMREGGMSVVCLAIVADTPTTRVSANGKGFEPYRTPEPGELYAHGQAAFARAASLIAAQNLTVVTSTAQLRAARTEGPAVIVTSEGADFLEGQVDRVDEALRLHGLRQSQLTHYRVNDLGDIQTEASVHGGLTDFGVDVVRRCNRLGIVVDVAHGPLELVRRVAATTGRPIVLSHTSLAGRPGPRSRQITFEHARLIASTGGVIGVWPNSAVFADLNAMAAGARRLADAIGVDHVGLGSDMLGFIVPPVFQSYEQLPAHADALVAAGFSRAEVGRVLGGNYQRVFEAVLASA